MRGVGDICVVLALAKSGIETKALARGSCVWSGERGVARRRIQSGTRSPFRFGGNQVIIVGDPWHASQPIPAAAVSVILSFSLLYAAQKSPARGLYPAGDTLEQS